MSPGIHNLTPIMVIALGSISEPALIEVRKRLKQTAPLLVDLSIFMVLEDDGELAVRNGRSEVKKDGSTNTKLDGEYKDGTWHKNFSIFRERVPEWANQLEVLERKFAGNIDKDELAFRDNVTISSKRDLWIVSTTYDPIGSAALFPMLTANLQAQLLYLTRSNVSCNFVLFGPETISDSHGVQGYGRTRSLVDEIESHEALIKSLSQAELKPENQGWDLDLWVLTKSDSDEELLKSPSELYRSVADLIELAQTTPARDSSPRQGTILRDTSSFYRRRYNTFGVKRIFFPMREAIESAVQRATGEVIDRCWLSGVKDLSPQEANAEVRTFVEKNGFLRIYERIVRNPELIAPDFRYRGLEKGPIALSGNFERILQEYEYYRKVNMTEIEKSLIASQRSLTDRLTHIVDRQLEDDCDTKERGPKAVRSYLRALTGLSRSEVGESEIDTPDDLLKMRDQVESARLDFYGLANQTGHIQRLERDRLEMRRIVDQLDMGIAASTKERVAAGDLTEELRQEAKIRRQTETLERLATLEDELKRAWTLQTESEVRVSDAIWRRTFLERHRDDIEQRQIEPSKEKLSKIESTLDELNKSESHINSNKRKFLQRIATITTISFGVVTLTSLILPLIVSGLGHTLITALPWVLITLVTVASGYTCKYLLLDYRSAVSNVRRNIVLAKRELQDCLKTVETALRLGLQLRFQAFVLERSLQLCEDLLERYKKKYEVFDQFCASLIKSKEESQKKWSDLKEISSVRHGSIAGGKLLDQLYENARDAVVDVREKIMSKNSLDTYLKPSLYFRSAAEGSKPAGGLVRDVSARLSPVFGRWNQITIDMWIDGHHGLDKDLDDELQLRVEYLSKRGLPVLAKYQEENDGSSDESFYARCHDPAWSPLEQISRSVSSQSRCTKVQHSNKHELLFLRRVERLRASEISEFVAADRLTPPEDKPRYIVEMSLPQDHRLINLG